MRRAGFTLVELLVAVSVASVALAAGFAALAMLQDRTAHAREAGLETLEGASTRATLIDWISGARFQDRARGLYFRGLDAESYALASDELYLPTTGRTPLGTPVAQVRLYLDQDLETPETGLVAELLANDTVEPERIELAAQVTGMRIRYLPDIDGEVEWTHVWDGEPQLPRAVEIQLEALGTEPLPPLLALPIRVALATLQ